MVDVPLSTDVDFEKINTQECARIRILEEDLRFFVALKAEKGWNNQPETMREARKIVEEHLDGV